MAIRVNRLRRDQDKSPPRWWGRSTRLILPLASAEARAFLLAFAAGDGGSRPLANAATTAALVCNSAARDPFACVAVRAAAAASTSRRLRAESAARAFCDQ